MQAGWRPPCAAANTRQQDQFASGHPLAPSRPELERSVRGLARPRDPAATAGRITEQVHFSSVELAAVRADLADAVVFWARDLLSAVAGWSLRQGVSDGRATGAKLEPSRVPAVFDQKPPASPCSGSRNFPCGHQPVRHPAPLRERQPAMGRRDFPYNPDTGGPRCDLKGPSADTLRVRRGGWYVSPTTPFTSHGTLSQSARSSAEPPLPRHRAVAGNTGRSRGISPRSVTRPQFLRHKMLIPQ